MLLLYTTACEELTDDRRWRDSTSCLIYAYDKSPVGNMKGKGNPGSLLCYGDHEKTSHYLYWDNETGAIKKTQHLVPDERFRPGWGLTRQKLLDEDLAKNRPAQRASDEQRARGLVETEGDLLEDPDHEDSEGDLDVEPAIENAHVAIAVDDESAIEVSDEEHEPLDQGVYRGARGGEEEKGENEDESLPLRPTPVQLRVKVEPAEPPPPLEPESESEATSESEREAAEEHEESDSVSGRRISAKGYSHYEPIDPDSDYYNERGEVLEGKRKRKRTHFGLMLNSGPIGTGKTSVTHEPRLTETRSQHLFNLLNSEVKVGLESPEWRVAEGVEYKNLQDKKTFEWVKKSAVPDGHRIIGTRYVRTLKSDGKTKKARLVAQDYGPEQPSMNSYVSTPAREIVRMMAAESVQEGLGVETKTADCRAAYLNGRFDEDTEIYVRPPKEHHRDGYVWRLRGALYGLKIAGRVWRDELDGTLKKLGYKSVYCAPSLYQRRAKGGKQTAIIVHVDDFKIQSTVKGGAAKALKELQGYYEIREVSGDTFLGIEYTHSDNGKTLKLHQTKKTTEIVKKYGFVINDPKGRTSTPGLYNKKDKENNPLNKEEKRISKFPLRGIVGELMWIAGCTRPDIYFSVIDLASQVLEPTNYTWMAATRILKYLANTTEWGISYRRGDYNMEAYVDSDWAAEQRGSRSQSGFIIFQQGGPISWGSKRQKTVAMSSAEAEYYAACDLGKVVRWVANTRFEMKWPTPKPFTAHEDNRACINISENGLGGRNVRHIRIRYHFLVEMVQEGEMVLVPIKSEFNTADALTKNLGPNLHLRHAKSMMTE
jgi:hypothetical protein